MPKILFELSPELLAAIDSERGSSARNPWIEAQLWRLKAVRAGAEKAGVTNPQRPMDGRGGDQRKKEGTVS